MKSLVLLALAVLPFGPVSALAGVADPVGALAEKIKSDPKRRVDAGKRLEALMLRKDGDARCFTGEGVDDAALGAVARDWADKADPGKLALLMLASAPGSTLEKRLVEAMSSWKTKKIDKAKAKTAAAAFCDDAADKAGLVIADPRTKTEIDAAIEANDAAPVVPEDAVERAVRRARELREKNGDSDKNPFGPDREPGSGDGGEPGSGGDSGGGDSRKTPANTGVSSQLPAGFKTKAGDPPAPNATRLIVEKVRKSPSGFGVAALWAEETVETVVYEQDDKGGKRRIAKASELSKAGREELGRRALETRRRRLEEHGIDERRAPEAYREAMNAPITEQEEEAELKSSSIVGGTTGTYGDRLKAGGHGTLGSILSYTESFADAALNPLMFVVPGIGRLASPLKSSAILTAKSPPAAKDGKKDGEKGGESPK